MIASVFRYAIPCNRIVLKVANNFCFILVIEDPLLFNWTPYEQHVATSVLLPTASIILWSLPITTLCLSHGLSLGLVPSHTLNKKTGKVEAIAMSSKFWQWYMSNIKVVLFSAAVAALIMGFLSHIQHTHFLKIEDESNFVSNPPFESEKIFVRNT